ncbi:hypothetical protein GCM10010254_65680 [Streptomyces chromofuscus]|nr:hypothetical protein GCM10010254_65680 [Streptomyces chromofuscus]
MDMFRGCMRLSSPVPRVSVKTAVKAVPAYGAGSPPHARGRRSRAPPEPPYGTEEQVTHMSFRYES